MARATTTKAARTSLEPSEIFCAVGLIMPTKKMETLCNDNTGASLLTWAAGDGVDLLKGGKVDYNNETKFENMFTNQPADSKKVEALIANIVAGFSAAIGIKDFMKSMGDNVDVVNKVYMTGARWPDDVNDFRLQNEDTGFDYNSSDLIAKIGSETFYGISLKKKKNIKGADPTLINKAYDTFLQGDGPNGSYKKARADMLYARQQYFPKIVKQAQRKGYIAIPGLLQMSDADIWATKVYDPKKKKNVALINLKGTNAKEDEVDPELTEFPDSLFRPKAGVKGMRDFINNDLSDKNNELYKEFERVIAENAEPFAEGLIDIVLKTQMQAKLSAKDIGDYHFEFCLVTGFADFTLKKPLQDSVLNLNKASVKPQHSILCGLANLAGHNSKYEMKYDKMKKYKSGASKLFYTLKRGRMPILDIQLRYKGDFKQQPQFFATLSEKFISNMHKKCEIKKTK
jgi:hypothetical protein